MRLAMRYVLGLLVIASTASCSNATAPACAESCDGDLVVFGRASITWSGTAVPGATVTVQLFGDTTTATGNCAGATPLVTATQTMDTDGNYRLPVVAPGAALHWVCVEVTADPHNWASDVGLNRVLGGVRQLRPAPAGGQSDSVRVDVHYAGLA